MDQITSTTAPGGSRNLPYDPVSADLAEAFFVGTPSGLRVRVYAWRETPAASDAPALLWGHANGFNAGCYAPFLSQLAEHFNVFAFDARGHGASDAPLEDFDRHYATDNFAMDLNAVVATVRRRLGDDRPLHYGAHSLGGVAALLLDGRFAIRPFESLTMFEPPIYPPPNHRFIDRADKSAPLFVAWAERRRMRFEDRAALRAEAREIVTYAKFTPPMLDAYVAAVAYDTGEGDIELFCPGLVESAVYRINSQSRVFISAAEARTRALIYSSDPALVDAGRIWGPPVLAEMAQQMANGEYRSMPGCGHLMVQEEPAACVAAILEHALGKK